MNKNFLLYIGVFLAGAVITPLYLSLFGDSEAESAEASSETLTFEENTTSASSTPDARSNQEFVPMDSQEVIANDYAVSPELQIPTSLPQYATNQPTIPGYPNYGAIPPVTLSFPEQPTTTSIPEAAQKEQSAIAQPKSSNPGLGDFTQDLKSSIFTPPSNRPDPNAVAPEPFDAEAEAIAPNSVNLNDFLNDSATSSEDCNPINSGNPFRPNTCE